MRKLWIGIGIIVVLGLIIVAMLAQEEEMLDEIKIGVLTSLTGQSGRYGESALNGIQIAVEEINNAGGIESKQIRLIIEDDGSDTTRAVTAFKKLAELGDVPIIIGPISSSASMSCSPAANELKVVLFSPSAATPAFTSPDDYTFRNRVSAEFEIQELAKVAYEELGLRNTGILYVNNDYGLGNKLYFESAFQELGGKILISETFDEGATDLRTQLSKIKDKAIDGIFIVGQGSEGGYALRQARELGVRTQFLSTITIQRTDVLDTARGAANGVIYALPTYDPQVFKEAEAFENKYKQRYERTSDLFSGNGYDAVHIVAEAIKLGEYSADGIKNALFTIKDFPGVTGNTSFDENGDVLKPVSIKKIQDGHFVYFEHNLTK
jgi:branched-chain amino acid transport system substrate-binding protein